MSNEKICKTCQVNKPIDCYYTTTVNNKLYHYNSCKRCMSDRINAKSKYVKRGSKLTRLPTEDKQRLYEALLDDNKDEFYQVCRDIDGVRVSNAYYWWRYRADTIRKVAPRVNN